MRLAAIKHGAEQLQREARRLRPPAEPVEGAEQLPEPEREEVEALAARVRVRGWAALDGAELARLAELLRRAQGVDDPEPAVDEPPTGDTPLPSARRIEPEREAREAGHTILDVGDCSIRLGFRPDPAYVEQLQEANCPSPKPPRRVSTHTTTVAPEPVDVVEIATPPEPSRYGPPTEAMIWRSKRHAPALIEKEF